MALRNNCSLTAGKRRYSAGQGTEAAGAKNKRQSRRKLRRPEQRSAYESAPKRAIYQAFPIRPRGHHGIERTTHLYRFRYSWNEEIRHQPDGGCCGRRETSKTLAPEAQQETPSNTSVRGNCRRPMSESVNVQYEEWIKKLENGRKVKFIYQELPEDRAFITAQLEGNEVVYSVVLTKARNPLSREDAESHFRGELSKK